MHPEIPEPRPELATAPADRGPSRTRILGAGLIITGVLVIAVFGVDWGAISRDRPVSELPTGIAIGERAPDFEAVNLSGDRIALSDLNGKVVLLNFWATWCTPCRIEMPYLQARHERYPEDLAVVGVDFDEPEPLVRSFADEFGLTFELVLDPGGIIQERYEIRGYPTTYFLDRDGVIRAVHIGVLSERQLDGYLRDFGLD
ncbi:MAG TPA: redoxin domain-containing protein [Anaerolineales bacterium]|nr:redoxin domain-containing protein [Anaerolineales bacterium]